MQTRPLQSAFRYFRSRRMALFERTLLPSGKTRILDVGGSPFIWEFLPVQPQVTFLNFPSALGPPSPNISQVAGDGCLLPFRDQSFDIVFSNSVIEHVGNREQQQRFAEEVARVGRSYWIQTPNRRFPVELHMMLPLVHYLPKNLQRFVLERFTIWERVVRPTKEERAYYVSHFLSEMNLLDTTALKSLFPEARVLREPFFGLTKSIIAVKA